MCVGGEPDVDYKLKVECRTAVQSFANQSSTSAFNDANQTPPQREGVRARSTENGRTESLSARGDPDVEDGADPLDKTLQIRL